MEKKIETERVRKRQRKEETEREQGSCRALIKTFKSLNLKP